MQMFSDEPQPQIVEQDDQFKCPLCLRMYASMMKLKTHMRKYCIKEKKYKCYFCQYRSKRRDHVRRHMRCIHSEKLEERIGAGLSMEIKEEDDDDTTNLPNDSTTDAALIKQEQDFDNDNDNDDDDEVESDDNHWTI